MHLHQVTEYLSNEPMHAITFSLHYEPPRVSYCETAKQTIHAIRNMSAQTKARLELFAIILSVALSISGALKVFVFMPPRVDALEKTQADQGADIKVMQAKASATDVAIAGIVPQLTAINAGVREIKDDIRELRNTKASK